VTLDVLGGGVLASLVTALIMWLNASRQRERTLRIEAERMPPLGEEAAKTYATKDELMRLEGAIRDEVSDIRKSIVAYDARDEKRAEATHRRIDTVVNAMTRNNRAIGVLIGIVGSKSKIPVSLMAADGD
jgi:hypothetical protein